MSKENSSALEELNDRLETIESKDILRFDVESLTQSEIRGLKWLIKERGFIPALFDRPRTGVDFIYNGVYGFEIKNNEPYSIRESQIKAVKNLEFVAIVIAKKDYVRIKDVIRFVSTINERIMFDLMLDETYDLSSRKYNQSLLTTKNNFLENIE